MGPLGLGWCSFYKQTILEKCPFRGTDEKLSKYFYMVLRGHKQASRVSDPSEQISAGYQTPLTKFPWRIILE
jgi:hypothetical protein